MGQRHPGRGPVVGPGQQAGGAAGPRLSARYRSQHELLRSAADAVFRGHSRGTTGLCGETKAKLAGTVSPWYMVEATRLVTPRIGWLKSVQPVEARAKVVARR